MKFILTLIFMAFLAMIIGWPVFVGGKIAAAILKTCGKTLCIMALVLIFAMIWAVL